MRRFHWFWWSLLATFVTLALGALAALAVDRLSEPRPSARARLVRFWQSRFTSFIRQPVDDMPFLEFIACRRAPVEDPSMGFPTSS